MSNPTFAECAVSIREELTKAEASAKEHRANLAALEVIGAKYPDAKKASIRRPFTNNWGTDVYYTYRSAIVWESGMASPFVDKVDPYQLGVTEGDTTSLRFASHVLYVDVPTADGNVRVYSDQRVDVIAGLELFQSSDGKLSLADALMSTVSAATKARADRAVELQIAESKKEEQRAKEKGEQALKDAKAPAKVQIAGTVVTKASV